MLYRNMVSFFQNQVLKEIKKNEEEPVKRDNFLSRNECEELLNFRKILRDKSANDNKVKNK